ncbi:MAG: endolytic transglycosylase MltG [Thermodesulfobacteriota bacterium]|nr:endolytic transglycosylase MltG [Thermodesulfobacteriota bacterium]
MSKFTLWFIFPALLLLPIIAFISYGLLFSPLTPKKLIQLQVEPGTGLNKVAFDLQEAEIVRSALAVKLLARWNQQSDRIQAGNYQFSDPATPEEILTRLVAGDVEKVSLTIPEGFTLQQIIARTAEKGFGQQKKISELAYNVDFIHSLKIDAESLEGYLFPETYLFAPGIDEKSLLTMMVVQFQNNIDPELKKAAKKQGLDLHQWVTLASIIEKETGQVGEMPLISSVFHNRLKRKIPLQTDPTVIYGIKNFDGNLTRKHLETPNPYNTYMMRGLPPGPIASPGLAALKAAVNPAQTKLLYFVATGNGGHRFSKTLKEHNAAVKEYLAQRRRNRKKK